MTLDPKQFAIATYDRGLARRALGERNKAHEDYTTVIDMHSTRQNRGQRP